MKKEGFKTEYTESKNKYVLTINGFSLPLTFKERDILYVIARKPGLSGYSELVNFLRERGFSDKIGRILKSKLKAVLRSFKKGVFWRGI